MGSLLVLRDSSTVAKFSPQERYYSMMLSLGEETGRGAWERRLGEEPGRGDLERRLGEEPGRGDWERSLGEETGRGDWERSLGEETGALMQQSPCQANDLLLN
ncbi:hypothetical protein BsWGS_25914 [Bradybaena similaris]